MTPLRITMAIGQLSPFVGGCEQQALRLAASLRDRGHAVEILTTQPRGTKKEEEMHGVPVRRLFNFGNSRGLWRLGIYTFMAHLGEQLLQRKSQTDIIHVHQAQHPAYAAVVTQPIHRIPVVVKVATAGRFGDLHQMRAGECFLGSSFCLPTVLQADRIIAISDEIADELRTFEVSPQRISQIPNGVILPATTTTPAQRLCARVELAQELGFWAPGPEDEIVVYVGRCKPQKAPDLLLGVWQRLRSRPRCHLFVLGDLFPSDPRFQQAAKDCPRIHVLGRRPTEDVLRCLQAADVLLHPTRGEGLSNTLLEAMSLGLPCVASGIPANVELLRGGAGLLAPPEDAACLAVLTEAVLADPERRIALGRQARARAQDFDMDCVATRYEDLYRSLLAERSSTSERPNISKQHTPGTLRP